MHDNSAGLNTMRVAIAIFAVVVLYKVNPEDCISLQSLLKSYDGVSHDQVRLEILLFDNTPSTHSSWVPPRNVTYYGSNTNVGLAEAYNYALQVAEESDWLLTLDQDTTLPPTFMTDLSDAVSVAARDPEVAAIVPQVVGEGRMLSPNYFALGAIRRYYPLGYNGIARYGTYAFNSGSLLRIRFLREIGGYNPMFWLDYCDAYIYARIMRKGMRVYVAGRIQVEHEFSLFDIKNRVSLERYRNIVDAGSAFWDMEFGVLGGLYYTASLVYRVYKHWRCGDDPGIRCETIKCLKRRLFLSKSWRLSEWQDDMARRIAKPASEQREVTRSTRYEA